MFNMTVGTHLSYCTKSTSFSKNDSTHYTRQGILCDLWICFWHRRHRQRYVSSLISNVLLSVHFHALEIRRLTKRFEAYGNVIHVSFNSTSATLGAKRSSPFESPTRTCRTLLGLASPKDDKKMQQQLWQGCRLQD